MERGSGVLLKIKRGGGGGEASEGKRVLLILEYDLSETTTLREGVTDFTQKKLQIFRFSQFCTRIIDGNNSNFSPIQI